MHISSDLCVPTLSPSTITVSSSAEIGTSVTLTSSSIITTVALMWSLLEVSKILDMLNKGQKNQQHVSFNFFCVELTASIVNKPHYPAFFSHRIGSVHTLLHECVSYKKLCQRNHPSCTKASQRSNKSRNLSHFKTTI